MKCSEPHEIFLEAGSALIFYCASPKRKRGGVIWLKSKVHRIFVLITNSSIKMVRGNLIYSFFLAIFVLGLTERSIGVPMLLVSTNAINKWGFKEYVSKDVELTCVLE